MRELNAQLDALLSQKVSKGRSSAVKSVSDGDIFSVF